MEFVSDAGIILMVLISDVFIIGGIVATLFIIRSWSCKQAEASDRIIRIGYAISVAITVVLGMIAETVIIMLILITVGYL